VAVDRGRHPDFERLARYVEGSLEASDVLEIEEHLLRCARCREVVAEASELMSAESAAPPETGGRRARPFRFRRRAGITAGIAVLAAAAATVILALVPAARWWYRPPFAALNGAYTGRRPLELRFPHASYGPLVVTRGSSAIDQPPAVLDALSAIRRKLDDPNADARWHHAYGLAALLMWQYDDAVRSLQRAADLGERTPDLWIDLASAHFERAEANNTPQEYTAAVELLAKALAAEPSNAAALFNRAVVFSKLNLFDAAIADFKAALQIERDKGWIEELRSKLADAEERRARLLGQVSQGVPPEFAVESEFENVLRYPVSDRGHSHSTKERRALAARLVADHHDRWLSDAVDLLEASGNARVLSTLGSLARVRDQLRIGGYSALEPAIDDLARASLPAPLSVWRDFERLYKISHSRMLADCPDATELRARALRLGYRWFEVQVALEQSTCYVGALRLADAQEATMRAIAVADANRLRIASLRACGFLSSHLADEARYQESFRVGMACLAEIVRLGYPLRRAHQFFDNMMRAAEALERWTVARSTAHMSAAVAHASGYGLLEAQASYKEAWFAEVLGDRDFAARLYEAAAADFERLPPSQDVLAYKAFVEVSALASRGDYEGLMRRRKDIPVGGNVFFEIPLLTSLASVALDRHDPVGAERYATRAVEFGKGAAGAPELIRRQLTQVLEHADALVVLARLDRGDKRSALTAWQDHLLRAATSIGPAAAVQDTDRLVSSGLTILTFANLRGRVGVWVERRDGVDFQWASASYDELTRRLRELAVRCRTAAASTQAIVSLAREIERSATASRLAGRRAHTLYVQAQGELGWMHLALGLADQSSTFLLNPFGLRAAASEPGGRGAGLFAVPAARRVRDVILAALPDADREVRNLGRLVGGAQVQTGSAVTSRTIDDALHRYRLVHFAGHGVRSSGGAALVVTPDPSDPRADAREGLWHLVPGTTIHSEIVVLSACSTASIEELDSAAPNGLAEGVIVAGAQTVIATLWDVESSTSERFNIAFYRSFVRQGSVVNAYRQAREELQRDPSVSLGSWAAFTLYSRINKD
jgi:tetratricopeptide (TPR) repeat protein